MIKYLFMFLFLTTLNLAFAQTAQLAEPKALSSESFEHLIDVDYSFFMVKTKLPWGVDPFLKEPGYVKVNTSEEKFELTGILYSKDDPMAIVNGKSVVTGDHVGDRVVEEIGENFVILKKKDSEIELNLAPINENDVGEDESDEEGVEE